MGEERFYLAVISPTANQRIAAEYEGVLRCFLNDREDDKWSDEFFDATKNEYVAGTHDEIKARKELQQKLISDNFEAYKQARLAEITAILKRNDITQKRREDLIQEGRYLGVTNSYGSFGRNIRNFGEYEFFIHYPEDLNDKHADNKKKLQAVEQDIRSVIDNRYAMMQSLAFAAANGDKIQTQNVDVDAFCDDIVKGLEDYDKYKDDGIISGTILDGAFDESSTVTNKNLAYKEVGIYIRQAMGMTQTYQDAVQALASSPIFKDMCRYYSAKAAKEDDLLGKVRWREGDYQYILQYAAEKGLIPAKDSDKRTMRLAKLCKPAVLVDRMPATLDCLEKLEKAQNEYNFMVKMVEDFNKARQQDPHLLDNNKLRIESDGLVQLNLDSDKYLTSMNKRLVGVANLMVQENTVSEVIWEVGKDAAISTLLFVPGLSLFGWGLLGTNMWAYTSKSAMDWQHGVQQKLFNDTGFNRCLANFKNKFVADQVKETMKEEISIAADRKQKIEDLGLNDNLDAMIEYGYNHSSYGNQEVFEMIRDARKLAKWPESDLLKLEQENIEAIKAHEKEKTGAAEDIIINMEQKELFKQAALIKMAKTGNYFYYAQLARNVMSDYGEEQVGGVIKKYTGDGLELLQKFNAVLEERVGSELELENRQILAKAWYDAGRPTLKEIKKNSLYTDETEETLALVDNLRGLFSESVSSKDNNQTLKNNSQQVDSLAYNESQLIDLNNKQNA